MLDSEDTQPLYPSLSSHVVYSNSNIESTSSSSINMPSASVDWKTVPRAIIDQYFRENSQDWEAKVKAFFLAKLDEASVSLDLPSLNECPIRDLSDGQIVRFRAMIQDIFDPEAYANVTKIRNLQTNEVKTVVYKYRDIVPLGPKEEAIDDEEHLRWDGERQSLYCVSVPAEAPWVSDGFKKKTTWNYEANCSKNVGLKDSNGGVNGCSSGMGNKLKRNHSVASESNEDVDMENGESANAPENNEEAKKAKLDQNGHASASTNGSSSSGNSNGLSLNLPLPNAKGKAAIVKTYDDSHDFKLNQVYEFIGIVSLDPQLGSLNIEGSHAQIMGEEISPFQTQETAARSPPSSLVPRIHVLKHRLLKHANPNLPAEVNAKTVNNLITKEDAERCRSELHSVLTKALLGDGLAADYIICHLVSKIYHREDDLNLGKFSINLHNLTPNYSYSKKLATLIQLLTTASHYMPMKIEDFNRQRFVPKKDHHANRLLSGCLQLPDHTHLILDETLMGEGHLQEAGVANITALGTLIRWQKVEYDFTFSKIDFATDVPCLILSEGRSMMPSDASVMLRPVETVGETFVSERFAAIGSIMNVELLERLRNFITACRHFVKFDVSDEMQAKVQQDFVSERSNNQQPNNMTAEDLHTHLVMSRLMSLSKGETTLTKETWTAVKSMEKQQKERVAHLPARSRMNNLANQV